MVLSCLNFGYLQLLRECHPYILSKLVSIAEAKSYLRIICILGPIGASHLNDHYCAYSKLNVMLLIKDMPANVSLETTRNHSDLADILENSLFDTRIPS